MGIHSPAPLPATTRSYHHRPRKTVVGWKNDSSSGRWGVVPWKMLEGVVKLPPTLSFRERRGPPRSYSREHYLLFSLRTGRWFCTSRSVIVPATVVCSLHTERPCSVSAWYPGPDTNDADQICAARPWDSISSKNTIVPRVRCNTLTRSRDQNTENRWKLPRVL